MEGRDLVLTGKPFTAHKYKEKTRPPIAANWLPTRVTIPTAIHEPNVTSSRGRTRDKSNMKSRSRPHSASVPGRKPFPSTRPATGLSAPVEHMALLSARDSKHSARINLTTAQAIDANMFTTVSEPYLLPSDKAMNKEINVLNADSNVNCKRISNGPMHKDNSCHSDDKQTIAAIRIQRWYRKIRVNKLESSQKLVQELLQQKKDDLNKSRIAELEKMEAKVCTHCSNNEYRNVHFVTSLFCMCYRLGRCHRLKVININDER